MPSARVGRPVCVCPTDGIIDLIGKKWTLCMLTTLGRYPRLRFNEFMDTCPGISPRTLSDTLQALRREGLVRREAFAEVPPRVEYSLTDEGRTLVRAIGPVMGWAARRSPALP